jgi:alkyl hydroperoxide reductase subunit AhpC
MPLKLGDEFPDFSVKTTIGDIQLHDWIGDRSVSVYVIIILYD